MPASHVSLGNSDTAQQSEPREQEEKREATFMTPWPHDLIRTHAKDA
jgi:hypothetical protein